MHRLLRSIIAMLFTTLLLAACNNQQQTDGANDFTLNAASGPVSLSDFRGSVVLLFFGYTHCPDICPATMIHVTQALKKLTAEQAQQVQVLFVSVDPERDTAAHLAEYLTYFNPAYIGLTGTKEAVKKVAGKYDAEFFRQDEAGNPNYDVVHTSHLFLINKQGSLSDIMSHHTKPDDIAIALEKWLNAPAAAGAAQ